MKIMTKKLEGNVRSISKLKNSNYSILAPLDLIINATKSNLVIQDQKNKYLKEMLRERIFYISHPSLSNLECSINLSQKSSIDALWPFGPQGVICAIGTNDRNIFFEETVKEILVLGNFNPKQIEIRDKSQTILFKDVAAMKLLNIIFKDNEDHALYPIYLKWIDGSEWMKY